MTFIMSPLKRLEDDKFPVLGGDVDTNGNEIIITDDNGDKRGEIGAANGVGPFFNAVDDEDERQPFAMRGSQAYMNSEAIYVALTDADEGEVLTLGAPVTSPAGDVVNPVYPTALQSVIIENSESNTNDFVLTASPQEVLLLSITNDFPIGSQAQFSFYVVEENTGRSTVVEYYVEVNGNAGPTYSSTVSGIDGTLGVIIDGAPSTVQPLVIGDEVKLFARVTQTGGQRVTKILGSVSPTSLKVKTYAANRSLSPDSTSISASKTIALAPRQQVEVFVHTTGNDVDLQLPEAATCTGAEVMLKKKGEDSSLTMSPFVGQNFNDQPVFTKFWMNRDSEFVTVRSNGANWETINRNTVAVAAISAGASATFTIPAGKANAVKLDLFTASLATTPGRLTPNVAGDCVDIAQLESPTQNGFAITFSMILEYPNGRNVHAEIYVGGNEVPYMHDSTQGLGGNDNISLTINDVYEASAIGDVCVYMWGEVVQANTPISLITLSVRRADNK